ncbi:conserved hypothetical protein [Treponema primitia ZAS-2]|uniref:Cthe-2314-like HEPN domain-containing protein n=1 Tax=Treponema primitia (strain ATCC BAA-887 / DSM 12427 / ZAS-2) TaxID=545694 RepID=D8L146_TREPZ|nr:hypothetical protein [Treponema primitia]ADJ19590.1 hypothetical protein [Treponema primitia ZAS-2]AEF84127.1 conserved hypothetical protein [Treponema primitia ZAS-2]
MKYTEDQLNQINNYFFGIPKIYADIVEKICSKEKIVKNNKAREYLIHGVNRRINILNQCIENIFEIYPPDRNTLLGLSNVTTICINLHAFLINVYGIIENLSLFIAYENNLFDPSISEKKQRNKMGLYKKDFYIKLNDNLKNHFSSEKSQAWYNEYAKNYRDALAHRIPPYVPPMELSDEDIKMRNEIEEKINNYKADGTNYNELHEMLNKTWTIGSPANYFLHSFSEKSKLVPIHIQIINDMITIKEMIFIVLDNI